MLPSLSLLLLPLLSPLATADPSIGCNPSVQKPVAWTPIPNEVKLFRVNDRNVRVTIPAVFNATRPATVVVAYHDYESSAEVLDYETGWSQQGEEGDVIAVYPAADEGRWSSELRPPQSNTPKSANYTEDIEFTSSLLHDLETLLCLDTSRIYAAGLGSGGGMMHLLACDASLSKSFAAFAAVGGAFGRAKAGVGPWGVCSPGRKVVPMLEIHGVEDRIVGYFLKEGENGKTRQIPVHWVEEWSERNGCGDAVGEAVRSESEPETWATELENGVLTETVEYGGAVVRVARQCFGSGKRKRAAVKEKLGMGEVSVLHYQIKRFGHGWPRQQLRAEKEIMFKDALIEMKKASQFFDTSKIVLDFFKAHKLPAQYAKREDPQPAEPVPQQQMPSIEEFEKQLRQMNAGKTGAGKWSEKQIAEKLQQFREAQKELEKAEGYKEEVIEEHDEL